MDSNSNITSHHILGFWFYVTWENESVGRDQYGSVWTNKSNPICLNNEIVDVCLDSYNSIYKKNLRNINCEKTFEDKSNPQPRSQSPPL
jgi:hypothetical protein